VGFLNHELRLAGKKYGKLTDYCTVIDTLPLARQLHPGQRNSLDALCKRYNVSNSHRQFHGGLLDAELLSFVYLAMTGGQKSLLDDFSTPEVTPAITRARQQAAADRPPLRIIKANTEELEAHTARLAAIDKIAKEGCVWNKDRL